MGKQQVAGHKVVFDSGLPKSLKIPKAQKNEPWTKPKKNIKKPQSKELDNQPRSVEARHDQGDK